MSRSWPEFRVHPARRQDRDIVLAGKYLAAGPGNQAVPQPDRPQQRIREQVTSQIEKFDTTLRVTLGEGDTLESGVKVYRGWNELEFPFTAGFSSSSPTLLISSASELETDLELGAIWWRIAD